MGYTDNMSPEMKQRIVQELVPGKQISLAHIIANPDKILYTKLGLDPSLDYSRAAIGIMTVSPAETAIIMADIAMKSSGIELGFVDRFSGSLIITGTVSEVEASTSAILDYVGNKLGFTVCPITRTCQNMTKFVLIGRSEAGKTTLTQALRGEKIHYHKTQYVNNFDVIVDTPGEYAQTKGLGHALALYTYESDVVGLLVSATEPYCLFPPCITCMANREVIGIVTKIHNPDANVKLATSWLELAGCKKIFYVDSRQQEGIPEILEYLREDGDVMPWEKDASDPVN